MDFANIDWVRIGGTLLKYSPVFELRIYIVASLFTFVFISIGVIIFLKKKIKPVLFQKLLWVKSIIIVDYVFAVIAAILILETMFVRPFVLNVFPEIGIELESADSEITVTFDQIINPNDLIFNLSPETKGEWIPKYLWGTDYAREFTFKPETSIYPGNPVILYVTGIKTPWSFGKAHEYAIEYPILEIPSIKSILPEDNAEMVAINESIYIDLDSINGDFVNWRFEFEPVIESYEINSSKTGVEVFFPNGLKQDESYSVKVYRTPRSYLIEDNTDLDVGDTELVSEFKFKTVTTPLVDSYIPKGNSVLIDEPIKIVFDQEMIQKEVEENFSITPNVVGKFTWEDSKTLLYELETPLIKDTQYKISIAEGIHSLALGEVKEPINIEFTTIGHVKVSSVKPVNKATGLAITGNKVIITFNQDVDHASVQSHFSMSPKVTGKFSWSGNVMTYSINQTLEYSTTYTSTVTAGIKTINGLDSTIKYTNKFTTKSNIVSLKLPWYSQQENFTCNIAATRMVLAYRGIYRSESSIKSSIGTGLNPNANWVAGYGVHAGPINSYISGYRGTTYKKGMSITDLTAAIDAGNPVVTWVYNRYSTPYGSFTLPGGYTGYKGMHSEVVRGYIGNASNPTHILINDPWRGQYSYRVSTFKSIWGYLGYTGIIVK